MTEQVAEPGSEAAEFDRLMALEHGDPAPTQPNQTADGAAPSQAAAPEGTGAQDAPADGGGEGGGNATEQAGATVADDDSWLAALPEDARNRITAERASHATRVKEAEDRFNALHGKLAPTQRALSEAQQRLAQLPAQVPAATPPVQAPNQSAVDFFDTPEWKQWAEDFPGDAKVMRLSIETQQRASQQALSALEGKLNQIAQRLDQTAQVTSRVVANDEIAKLDAAHKDWRQVNESDDFWSWFDEFRASQPKSIRPMYYDDAQLAKMFNDAEFNIGMLDSYKAARQAATPTPAVVTPTVPDSTQPATPPAQSVRQSMAVAPDVRGSGSAPASVPLDSLTPAQQFEHIWNNT